MARHNRESEGTDQHGVSYTISYQPDWLRQIKISRTLSGRNRQSTKTLFRNPLPCAERKPGDRVRLSVTSEDGEIDFEVAVTDPERRVDQIIVTSRTSSGREDITFTIDGGLPLPGDIGKSRRRRRRS